MFVLYYTKSGIFNLKELKSICYHLKLLVEIVIIILTT